MTEIKRKGENTEERMEMAYEGARGYFRQGLNCAECVLKAFMEVYDTGFLQKAWRWPLVLALDWGTPRRVFAEPSLVRLWL